MLLEFLEKEEDRRTEKSSRSVPAAQALSKENHPSPGPGRGTRRNHFCPVLALFMP